LKPPNDVFVPVNSEELKSKSVSYVMRPCPAAPPDCCGRAAARPYQIKKEAADYLILIQPPA